MTFLPPMLASPQNSLEKIVIRPGEWIAEQKYDGHRMIVEVSEPQDLFGRWRVTAWSRDGLVRALPRQITDFASDLPRGLYDGELIVPSGKSYDVTRLDRIESLHLVLFDLLERSGVSLLSKPLRERRLLLEEAVGKGCSSVSVAQQHPLQQTSDVIVLASAVWAVGGEGLVVKKLDSVYRPGKRPKDWIKIKQLRTAVLKVVGFRDGTRGPNTVLVLLDADGNQTSVKAKNDLMIAELRRDSSQFLRRDMRIEFQERTPDGSYRHPRMDRWEDE